MDWWPRLQGSLLAKLLLSYVIITSGLIVNFLQLCSCLLWPLNKTLYRKLNYLLIQSHWRVYTALAQWWSGMKVTFITQEDFSEDSLLQDHCMVIMNHRADLDWLLTILLAEKCDNVGGARIFGKDALKYVPVFGWAMYFGECIFLKRDKDKDKEIIQRDISRIVGFPYKVILLLCCEGTRFTTKKHEASNKVAREKGIQELKHHLLPRTKGFVLGMHGLKGNFEYIWDLTTVFRPDAAKPTLTNVAAGKQTHAEIFVRRIKIDNVPMETDEACAEWCHQLYREKDEIYDSFIRNGSFEGKRFEKERTLKDLVVLVVWSVLLLPPLFWSVIEVAVRGSPSVQIGLALVAVLFSVLLKKLFEVGEAKKSSSYGTTKPTK